MPHFKDGTEAKVGDLIKGTGYNIKDASGKLAVIVGTLARITPNSDTCNLVILTTIAEKLEKEIPVFATKPTRPTGSWETIPAALSTMHSP